MVKLQNNGPVIIVDDDQDVLDIAKYVFEKSKILNTLVSYPSGSDLLNYLKEVQQQKAELPAIILLDINMPKPNGYEILREIRSKNIFKDLPIIMLTSSNDKRDIELALAEGANAYQVKPFDIDEFIEFADSLVP